MTNEELNKIVVIKTTVGSMIDWKAKNVHLTKDEAMTLQSLKGYHPGGYNFLHYSIVGNDTTWRCYSSSD